MEAPSWDDATLEDLSQVMVDASICGLGQAAPNPVRSVLQVLSRTRSAAATPPDIAGRRRRADGGEPP